MPNDILSSDVKAKLNMLKRIIITMASIAAGTLLIALVIFYFSSVQGLREYCSIVIYCSIAVALIGGSMFCITGGPGGSDEAYARLMMARSHPAVIKTDQEDQARGASLGLVIFASGVLSGGIGVGLYYLAEHGIIGA